MLTSDYLDSWIESILVKAGRDIAERGWIAGGLFGVNAMGTPTLSAITVPDGVIPEPTFEADTAVWMVPVALRDWTDWLGEQFAANDAVAVIEFGQFERTPDGPDAATSSADGTSRSMQSRPLEGAFVSGLWPEGNYQRIVSQRIVRAGGRSYLRPWDDAPTGSVDHPAWTGAGSATRAAQGHLGTTAE